MGDGTCDFCRHWHRLHSGLGICLALPTKQIATDKKAEHAIWPLTTCGDTCDKYEESVTISDDVDDDRPLSFYRLPVVNN